jgi:hypothetical protein
MKAKSKSELAELAGVSVCTLVSWFKPHMAELEALVLRPGMRVLPPKVVKFIADKYDIDITD